MRSCEFQLQVLKFSILVLEYSCRIESGLRTVRHLNLCKFKFTNTYQLAKFAKTLLVDKYSSFEVKPNQLQIRISFSDDQM